MQLVSEYPLGLQKQLRKSLVFFMRVELSRGVSGHEGGKESRVEEFW